MLSVILDIHTGAISFFLSLSQEPVSKQSTSCSCLTAHQQPVCRPLSTFLGLYTLGLSALLKLGFPGVAAPQCALPCVLPQGSGC